jgi:hypothetical protein
MRYLRGGDDAEIPTTAAQGPEEVLVFGRVGGEESALGSNYVRRDKVVASGTECAHEPAVSAPRDSPADANLRIRAAGNGKAEGLGCMVHIAPRDTRLRAHYSFARTDANAFHARQINDRPVITQGSACYSVAGAADGQW